jgi:hypothetical protein
VVAASPVIEGSQGTGGGGEGRPAVEAPPRLQVTDGVTCGARDVEDERCLSQTISRR